MCDNYRERIKKRIAELGLSMAEVNRRVGAGPTLVNDILSKGATPSIDNLAKISDVLGVSLATLYFGGDRVQINLRITGIAGKGEMWTAVNNQNTREVPLEFFDKELVNILITDDSYEPKFHKGDVVLGPKQEGLNLDNIIGTDCIVETRDGRKFLRVLVRGTKPGKYTLRADDPRDEDVRDVILAWAAPVRMILRGIA